MKRLTFAELATADERTQRFTPYGLSTGTRILSPEACCQFQQDCVASELDEIVPASTRAGFDRLRLFHTYGVVCYELFTITDDLTWIVLEQALRVRFIAYYQEQMPVKDKQGSVSTFAASDFEVLSQAFRRGGSHYGFRLDTGTGTSSTMPLTLEPLLKWAHHSGLLDGQRNRRVQLAVYADRRNHFAHGGSVERLGMPPDSARSIRDLGEIINRLWGVRTPGGRIYPAPIARELFVLAWSDGWPAMAGSVFTRLRPQQLQTSSADTRNCLIVLAPDVDQNLHEFDARYEVTPYPVDWLWGPGDREGALAWLAANPAMGDNVSTIDRIFAIRIENGRVYLPMRPEIFKSVPTEMRGGRWRLIQADFPNDAHFHIRHQERNELCPDQKYGGCPVTELADGSWSDMFVEIQRVAPDSRLLPYVEARVPPRDPYPDDVGC